MIEIPLEDSTALAYLAEYHGEMDESERQELIAKLSPKGQEVARAIVQESGADSDEIQVARTLKDWARHAAETR